MERSDTDMATAPTVTVGQTRREAREAARADRRRNGALSAILNGLSGGLLALILGFGIAVIGVPAVVGGASLSILTGSMTPTLPPGTLIVIKPTPVDEIGVGDVLTYQIESGQAAVVSHRVIEVQTDSASGERRFITQGDANNVADAEPVRPVQVKGTVWYAIPYLGWVNQAVNGPARSWIVPGIAVALFAYAAWTFGSGVWDRRRKRAHKAEPGEAGVGSD